MLTETGSRPHWARRQPGVGQRNIGPKRTGIFSLAWLVCFLSLFMLGLVTRLGGPAAALFLLPWGILVIRAPELALTRTAENASLFLLPALALLSTAWSQYPSVSLRAAIQLLLTVEIAVLAGSLTNPRTFLSAFLSALTAIMVASLAVDGGASFRGGAALMGVFQSKNQLASYMVIELIVALTVVFDRLQPVLMRLVALFALLLGPICLVAAQSTGAIVFSIPALGALLACMAAARLPGRSQGYRPCSCAPHDYRGIYCNRGICR